MWAGGTLLQDIALQHPGALQHKGGTRHTIRAAPGSELAALAGEREFEVNSYHHQGVKDVAPGLTVNAWAPDGLVEGLEGPGVIALQWHPEMLFETHPEHRLPFEMLIKMCTNELAPA